MNNKEKYIPFSHPRWNDRTLPEVTGRVEFTEEELEQSRQELLTIIAHEKDVIQKQQ